MKILLCLLIVVAVAVPSAAFDLGSRAPAKLPVLQSPPPVDPAVLRQGGDTILDAVEIQPWIYGLTGTTAGYNDDYDEVCPYDGSTSPDVVYTWVLDGDASLVIDMYGSSYDTKIYVYGEDLNLVDCNDDYYSDFTSLLVGVFVEAGVRYYLVIDGYGGDSGDYLLSIDAYPVPYLDCPPGAQLEGEPELVDDYVDLHNGGCNTDAENPPFQHIDHQDFCGVGGWYLFDGVNTRDTDWFTITLPATGSVVIAGDAEYESYLFELGPQDCGQVGVLQSVEIGPFMWGEITVAGEPGSEAWIWVGSTSFESPGGGINEYAYLLWFDSIVAVENHSWTAVKSLFD